MASESTTTASQETGGVRETEAQADYSFLVIDDAPAESAAAAEKSGAPAVQETKPAATEAAVKPDSGEVPAQAAAQTPVHQPGTPDKALQKLQQDQATIQRTLSQLLELTKAGQPLTATQQQQVQQQQRKLDVIRAKLAAKEDDKKFDPFDDAPVLAESVIEQDEKIATLEQRLAKLEAGTTAADDTAVFTQLRQKYAGVDVEGVWDKAVEDAAGIIGAENPALGNLADRIFHQRALAAANSVKAKAAGGKQEQQQQQQNATQPTGATPGAARVTVQTGVAPASPLSEEDEYLRNARSLVVTD